MKEHAHLYRIKETVKENANGMLNISYMPQYKFMLFWIFPMYFNMRSYPCSKSTAEKTIQDEINKEIKKKKVNILRYDENSSDWISGNNL